MVKREDGTQTADTCPYLRDIHLLTFCGRHQSFLATVRIGIEAH